MGGKSRPIKVISVFDADFGAVWNLETPIGEANAPTQGVSPGPGTDWLRPQLFDGSWRRGLQY
jgi:hypothetical protein